MREAKNANICLLGIVIEGGISASVSCTFLPCLFLKICGRRARQVKEEGYIQKGNSQTGILQLSPFDHSLKVISSVLKLVQPAH